MAHDPTTTGRDPEATVREFLSALERMDVEAALAFAAPDVVYQNVPLRPARGIAEVERQLRTMGRYCTGFEGRLRNVAAAGPVVLTERTDVLKAGAWEAEFWVCGTFEVRDGLIVLWRDYFDWTTFLAAAARGGARALVSRIRARLGRSG